jgi:hypothetical protein
VLLGDSVLADVTLAGIDGRGAAALLTLSRGASPRWHIASAAAGTNVLAGDDERLPRTAVSPWTRSDARTFAVASGRDTVYVGRVPGLAVWIRGASRRWEGAVVDPLSAVRVAGSRSGVRVVSCPAAHGRPRVWRSKGAAPADAEAACREIAAGTREAWRRVRKCRWWWPRSICVTKPDHPLATLREPRAPRARVLQPRVAAELPGLWVRMRSSSLEQLDVGSRAGHPWTVSDSATGDTVAVLGRLELKDSSVARVGPHSFVVRARGDRLDLLHARRPGLPAYLGGSAGTESYHPAWLGEIPRCGASPGALRVRVAHPSRSDPRARPRDTWIVPSGAAAGARERVVELEGGVRDSARTESVILCTAAVAGRERQIRIRSEPAATVELEDGAAARLLPEDTVVRVGDRPGELLLGVGGTLVRVAPSRAGAVQRAARTGGGAFLGLALLVQAFPLTVARRRRAAFVRKHPDWGRELLAPAGMSPATCLQLASIAISLLLFVGLAFQMYLSTHPDLAATPTYGQSFIQAMTLTVAVLCFAAWFTFLDRGIAYRTALGLVGVALAFALAFGWCVLDARLTPATGMWFSRLRDAATVAGPVNGWRALLALGAVAVLFIAAGVAFVGRLLGARQMGAGLVEWALAHPVASSLGLAGVGCAGAGVLYMKLDRGALALHLSIMAALAWYAAVHWDQADSTDEPGEAEKRSESMWMLRTSVAVWVALVVFLLTGAGMPKVVSLLSLVAGAALGFWALRRGGTEGHSDVILLVLAWGGALVVGGVGALWPLDDMGSLAAWIPAVLAGFFLWAVQTEEAGRGRMGAAAARVRFWLAAASGLMLLGALDALNFMVEKAPEDVLERPRQRFALVENAAYPTAGEWITQVRWLASEPGGGPRWVPNLNSDLAVFGVSSNFGLGWAFLISLVLVAAAFLLAFAADQALREARLVEEEVDDASAREDPDAVRGYAADAPAVLLRATGLLLGMTAILLPSQWLVHLGTGVAPQIPITGLVFPWVSHGTTTHLLYAAALVLPLAAWSAVGEWRVAAGGFDAN